MKTTGPKIRVLIADDHPPVLAGLASIIGMQPDMVVIAEATDGRQLVEHWLQHRPDVRLCIRERSTPNWLATWMPGRYKRSSNSEISSSQPRARHRSNGKPFLKEPQLRYGPAWLLSPTRSAANIAKIATSARSCRTLYPSTL